jgi:LPXTG-motif cell wall-anchored protein
MGYSPIPESPMTTILIIVLVVLLLGGGGWFGFRGRR